MLKRNERSVVVRAGRIRLRDLVCLAVALAIALGWYAHWSLWHGRYDDLLQEQISTLKEQPAANVDIPAIKKREMEMEDLQRRYEQEVENNAKFRVEFDERLKQAVENVRRIHAESGQPPRNYNADPPIDAKQPNQRENAP